MRKTAECAGRNPRRFGKEGSTKNERLFRLLYLLLERGGMRAPELASALEVCVRTIYRDVEALSKAGAPMPEAQPPAGCLTSLKLQFAPAVAFRVLDEFDRSCISTEADGHLRAGGRARKKFVCASQNLTGLCQVQTADKVPYRVQR